MTEAWLLLDAGAICRAAARPSSERVLALSKPSEVERIADPKAQLQSILVSASGYTGGRRLRTFKQRFGAQRRALLEHLDPSGPLADLPSWRALRSDDESALRRLTT